MQLDPGDAFGEYDPELLKIEPRTRFPDPLEVGMQFEGVPDADDFSNDVEQVRDVLDEGDEDDPSAMIYTVTDVAENQVVLDGNHPLAGMALRFWLQVEEVRIATGDEIQNRHPQGAEGLGFGILDEGDEELDEDLGQAQIRASGARMPSTGNRGQRSTP